MEKLYIHIQIGIMLLKYNNQNLALVGTPIGSEQRRRLLWEKHEGETLARAVPTESGGRAKNLSILNLESQVFFHLF